MSRLLKDVWRASILQNGIRPGSPWVRGQAGGSSRRSGIRSGSDVLKAKALGADAVLLGRPYIWGLALAGTAGVREVIQRLLADVDLSMALAGQSRFATIERDLLAD